MRRFDLLRPFQHRDFAVFWVGMSLSLIGDGAYFVAVPWAVLQISNVATALSIVGFAWSLPQVIFMLVGGVVSDRIDRRLALILADAVRGFAIALFALDAFLGQLVLWHVIVFVALYGVGEALFAPSYTAIMRRLVPEEILVDANTLNQLCRPFLLRIAGPAVGGLAITQFGTGGVLAFDAGTFAVSMVAMVLVRAPKSRPRPEESSFVEEMREGFTYVRARQWLLGYFCVAAVAELAFAGPWNVLVPFVIKNSIGGSASDLGYVLAAGGLGALVGTWGMTRWRMTGRFLTRVYLASGLGGLMLVPIALATSTWQAALARIVMSAAFTVSTATWATVTQRYVPDELLGRVASLDAVISIGLVPVSFLIAGPIASMVGARSTLLAAGVIAAAANLTFLFVAPLLGPERDQERYAIVEESLAARHS